MFVGETDSQGNLCTTPPIKGAPTQFFLTPNGDGTGTYSVVGNYSAAATDFYYAPTTGEYHIASVLISVSAPAKLLQSSYGHLPALTNGVKFFLASGPYELPLVSGIAVKTNYEYTMLTPHTSITDFSGLAQTFSMEVRMKDDYGMYLALRPGMKFIVRVQDNFSTLVAHTFGLRGIKT